MQKINKAIELRRDGRIIESTELLESIEIKDGRIHFECAWNYSIQANAQQAIQHYEQAIELEIPKELLRKAYMDLAFNYFEEKEFIKAQKLLDKGFYEFDDFGAVRAMLTIIDYKMGHSKEAIVNLMNLLLEPTMSKEIQKYRKELMYYVQK